MNAKVILIFSLFLLNLNFVSAQTSDKSDKPETQSDHLLVGANNNIGTYVPFFFQTGMTMFYERYFSARKWSAVINGIYVIKDKQLEVFPELRYYFHEGKPHNFVKTFLGSKQYSYDFYAGGLITYKRQPGFSKSVAFANYELLATLGAKIHLDKGFNVGAFAGLGYGINTHSAYGEQYTGFYKGIASKLPFYHISFGYRF